MNNYTLLREAFIHLCTVDSETKDGRRKEHNRAIFGSLDYKHNPGYAVFNNTTFDMVLDKFDEAVKAVKEERDDT